MLQPEEDFPTWLMILQSTTDNVDDFNKFIPDIERLLDSIEQTDELPDLIKEYKNDFIQKLHSDIIRRFQSFGYLPEPQLDIIYHFFQVIIKFSCYGIKSSNIYIIYLLSCVIMIPDCSLFKNNYQYNFYQKLCEYALECNFLADGMKSLSELPNSIEVIYWIYIGLHYLIEYTNETNFWELSSLTLKATLHICEENLRNIPTLAISNLFNETLNSAFKYEKVEKEFIILWLEIVSLFVKSDIFEKQLNGLKGISALITKDESKNFVLEWFRNPDNLSIMSGNDIHQEFFLPYNSILSELTAADLLTDTFLQNLWKLHTVQHSTQLFQFFLIFNTIASKLDPIYMTDFVSMCLDPESESEIWVKFISKLGITVGKRNDSPEAFSLIREKLFSLSFSGNSNINITAQNGLSIILQFYLDSDTLVEYTKRLWDQCGNTLLFYQLLHHATKFPFEDENFSYEILKNAITFAVSETDKPSLVYPFIENICTYNKIPIPEDALEDLFNLFNSENFYPFIINLIKGGFVSFDYVEHFILNMDNTMINEEFFELVKEFIMKVNNDSQVLKKLPIEKEEILWLLATTESKCRNLFTELLCKLYANNDGIELSDHLMIHTFFSKWDEMRNHCNQNLLLNLLKWFIVTIESPIDVSFYDVKRHDPSLYLNTVTVNVSSPSLPLPQVHEVPESMLVSALKHRISRTAMKPMNKFRITMNQNYLNELDTIKTIANGNKSINVSIKFIDNEKGYPEYHERTCVPSYLISQSFISDDFIEMLKENNEDAKKLLDYLPTNLSTIMKIHEIEKKEHFDYNELLTVEFPSLFTYNLEALKNSLDCDSNGELFKSFERTGGFIFLTENVNSPVLMKSIVPFLENELTIELKKKLGQQLFDAIFPSLVMEKPHKSTFITNANFLINIASTCCEIILPEEFYESIDRILFSSKKYVKNYGNNLLSQIKIPLNVFLDQLDENNQDIIFSACVPHIDSYHEQFYKMFIENPHSYPLLLITNKALDNNLIDDDEIKNQLQQVLISNYLTIDSRPKDKNCFTVAVHCLYKLRNQDLLQHLTELHSNKIMIKDWRIDGDSTAVSSNGFSGLINLGATCFLNSTLQQFFAIPPLRKSIVEYDGEDPFMIQLRNLFARMLYSKGHPVSTEELVKEWTGWDGEKMNPRVQQDACEFVQILIDKLEKGLGKEFIQSLFAGTTVDNIEGISEEYHSTRDQPFYTFTMPIKDLNNVEEALYAMQNPDFFTGANQYYADQLDRKIDAKKFQKIGSLPPYFIVQLSRFSYDYNTWERSKIDSQFEFPVNLDLSNFTCVEDQNTNYKLRGVIIHAGNALCGHYISYVFDRKKGNWLCCNDSHVSDVSEEDVLNDAYGKYQFKNAYLLFYDREDTQETQETETENHLKINFIPDSISISDELKESIDYENKLNDEYSLFCSSPYFEFCKLLANSNDINYAFIALRYYFDIFPFTTHVDKTEDLANSLTTLVNENEEFRNMLAEYLSCGYFQSSLVYCPSDKLRRATLMMIDSLDPNQYSDLFLEKLFCTIEGIVPYFSSYSEYFELIERIITKSENATLYATNKNWVTRFTSFLIEDIPKMLNENHNYKPTYFYSVTDISGLFRAIANLNPPEELISYVLDQEFFKFLLYNPRHPVDSSSIIDLLRSFSDFEEVKNFISHFSIHCGIYVDPFKLLRIIYNILKEDSFDLIAQSIMKTKEDTDFAASLAGEAMYDTQNLQHEFHQILLDNLDKWILKYLINDNTNCRLCALYIVAFLAPSQAFNNLLTFPVTNASSLYGDIIFSFSNENENEFDSSLEDSLQNAHKILEYLYDHASDVIEKIAELSTSFPGLDYIDCIIRLSKAIDSNVSEFFVDFAANHLVSKVPFDLQKREIVRFLGENYPQLVTIEFIMQMMDYPSFSSPLEQNENENASLFNNKSAFVRALKFFEALECLADSLQPPKEFVDAFVKELAFTPFPHSSSSYKTISTFIIKWASLYPDSFIDYIKMNLSLIAINCFSLLLVTLETTKTKMPILPYLALAATTKKQFFTLDELILKCFELNEEIEEEDHDEIHHEIEIPTENHDQDTVTITYEGTRVRVENEQDANDEHEENRNQALYSEEEETNNNNNESTTEKLNEDYKAESSESEPDSDEEEDEYEKENLKQVSQHEENETVNARDGEGNNNDENEPQQRTELTSSRLLIIDSTQANDQRILPLVSLLNSPQVGSSSRQARHEIWNLVLVKKPSYPAFKTVFNWRGDWDEFTSYLLSIAPTLISNGDSEEEEAFKSMKFKELIDDLIECSKNSAQSFALAEDFLLEYAYNEIMKRGFTDYLLKLDIGDKIEYFAKYLTALFSYINESTVESLENKDEADPEASNDEDEKEENDVDSVYLKKCQDAISSLIVAVERRVKFLVNVFDDVRNGAIGLADLSPLFSPLELLSKFKFVIENTELVDDLKNLQICCNNEDVIKRVSAVAELRKLCNLISNVI